MGGNSSQPQNAGATAQQGVQPSVQRHESSRSSEEERLSLALRDFHRTTMRRLLEDLSRSSFMLSESDASEMGGSSSQPQNAGASAQQGVQPSGTVQRHESSSSNEEECVSLALSGFRPTRIHSLIEGHSSCSFKFSGSDGSEMGGSSSQPQNAGATAQQGVQSSGQQTGIILSGSSTEERLERSISSETEVPPSRPPQCRTRRRRLSEDSLKLSCKFAGKCCEWPISSETEKGVLLPTWPLQCHPGRRGISDDDLILSCQFAGKCCEWPISSETEKGVLLPTRPLQCHPGRRGISDDDLILSCQFAAPVDLIPLQSSSSSEGEENEFLPHRHLGHHLKILSLHQRKLRYSPYLAGIPRRPELDSRIYKKTPQSNSRNGKRNFHLYF